MIFLVFLFGYFEEKRLSLPPARAAVGRLCGRGLRHGNPGRTPVLAGGGAYYGTGSGGVRLRDSLPHEHHVRHSVRRVPHGRAVPFRRIYLFKTYAGSGDSGSIVGGSGRE